MGTIDENVNKSQIWDKNTEDMRTTIYKGKVYVLSPSIKHFTQEK